MIASRTVHVASRSPSALGDGGTGAFEWRHDRAEAAAILADWLIRDAQNPSVNMALTTLEVPAYEDPAKITRWIDENWHLIEVALHSD